MHFYSVYFQKSFRVHQQYRLSTLVNNVGSIVFGFMYIAIWQGTLGPTQHANGLTPMQMALYVAFMQSLVSITTFLPRGFHLEERVRTGAVSLELMRPVSFFGSYLMQGLAVQAYNLLLRSLPMFLVFALVLGLPDLRLALVPWVVVSLLFAAYIGFLLQYFVGLAAFWTHSVRWAFIVHNTLMMTFSGFLVPVPLLPGPLAVISAYSPFAAQHYYPAMAYLGYVTPATFWVPLLWSVLLTVLALWLTHRARRRIEVQGG